MNNQIDPKKKSLLQRTPLVVLLVPSFISFIVATLVLLFFLTRH